MGTIGYKALLKQLSKLDASARLERARLALRTLVLRLKELGNDNAQIGQHVKHIICVFISSDRHTSPAERGFLNQLLGTNISVEDFYKMLDGSAREQYIHDVHLLLESLGAEAKLAALTMGLCFMLADDYFAETEMRLYKQLFI